MKPARAITTMTTSAQVGVPGSGAAGTVPIVIRDDERLVPLRPLRPERARKMICHAGARDG